MTLSFTQAALGAGAAPQISVVGQRDSSRPEHDGAGTTANQLAAALNANSAASQSGRNIASAAPGRRPIAGGGARSLRVLGLGSSYDTAYDLGQLGDRSLLVASSIDPQSFALDLPGGQDEPGHRDIPTEVGSGFEQHINPNFGPDVQDGVTTILYNFRQVYGYDAQGNPLSNLITEKQKTRVREAVELWAKHLGVQFLETANQGLTFVTGDPRALDPNDPNVLNHALNVAFGDDYDFIVRVDPTYTNGMIILDSARQWNSDFGADWFQRVMVGLGAMLGLQRANDLPVTNLMAFDSSEPYQGAPTSFFGSLPPEPIFPGNADIIHGQFIHRPDSNDIDLYRFTIDLNDQQLDEKKKGLLTAESFAERLPNSSELDAVLSLYREVEIRDANGQIVGYERELISRNDNYYSSDSYLSLELGSGTYYLGVTASGNTDFDPVIEDTGFGGTTQGAYELRLNFRSQVDDDDTISDLDRIDENRPGTRLDGDANGTPGGVFNFWFQTRPLDRVLRVTGDGNTYVDGQLVTIEDAFGNVRRFEFDSNNSLVNPSATRIPFTTGLVPTTAIDMANQLYNAINGSGLAVTATQAGTSITLKDERVTLLSGSTVGVELEGKTIFVDKTSGTNLRGTLEKPFDNISTAFAAAVPGDLVRIVGNGGFDGDRTTLSDNFAYEIGFGSSGGPADTGRRFDDVGAERRHGDDRCRRGVQAAAGTDWRRQFVGQRRPERGLAAGVGHAAGKRLLYLLAGRIHRARHVSSHDHARVRRLGRDLVPGRSGQCGRPLQLRERRHLPEPRQPRGYPLWRRPGADRHGGRGRQSDSDDRDAADHRVQSHHLQCRRRHVGGSRTALRRPISLRRSTSWSISSRPTTSGLGRTFTETSCCRTRSTACSCGSKRRPVRNFERLACPAASMMLTSCTCWPRTSKFRASPAGPCWRHPVRPSIW